MKNTPWTDDQVASLNGFQNAGYVHEFTSENGIALIATNAGWVEVEGGPVVQDWAHGFMLDWSWRHDNTNAPENNTTPARTESGCPCGCAALKAEHCWQNSNWERAWDRLPGVPDSGNGRA